MVKKACRRTKIIPPKRFKPFEKKESQEAKECVNRCRQVLRKPLIRGFVEIVKSKRFLRKASKLIVFFICTTGFVYQTWAFLQIYLTYPTVQDISKEYPEEFGAPAITICNNNRFSRHRLCKIYPSECEWQNTTTWDEFCETHKKRCLFRGEDGVKWYKYSELDYAVPRYSSGTLDDCGTTVLNALGPQREEEFVIFCKIIGNETSYYCNSSIMIQAVKNGYPYKCFSFLSLLGNRNAESLQLSLTDEYILNFEMRPEEYIVESDLVQAFVVIHDPRKLVNPFSEGVAFPAGYLYKLYPTMEKKISLPPPYATKCVDYLKEWKRNGGYGPLSKKDCIDLCIINAMVDKYDCAPPEAKYPNNYNTCRYSVNDVITAAMMKKCYSVCGDECEESTYSFTSEILRESSPGACDPKDEFCIGRYLEIEVSFIRMTVETFQHIPRFESIELFSYIGGYLGMWLGISLAYLFDFAEMMYNIVHSFLKGKRQKRRQRLFKKFRHETVEKKEIKI